MSAINSMDLMFLNSAVAHLHVLAEPFFFQDISLLYFLFCKMALLDIYINGKTNTHVQGFFLYPWGLSGLFSSPFSRGYRSRWRARFPRLLRFQSFVCYLSSLLLKWCNPRVFFNKNFYAAELMCTQHIGLIKGCNKGLLLNSINCNILWTISFSSLLTSRSLLLCFPP